MNVSCILLTAGLSSRMEGENKMLLPLGDSTVISQTYLQLQNSGLREIVVVTGRDSEYVKSEVLKIQPKDPKIIYNPKYENGLTTSIQVGLKAVQPADAVMICLADMPFLKADDYRFLIESFLNQKEYSIQVPFYNRQKGNPVIFGKQHFQEILNHKEMNGCFGVVANNRDNVYKLSVSSDRFLKDIDTQDAYQQTLKDFE